MTDPSYRAAAERDSAEIAASPGVEGFSRLVEAVMAGRHIEIPRTSGA